VLKERGRFMSSDELLAALQRDIGEAPEQWFLHRPKGATAT